MTTIEHLVRSIFIGHPGGRYVSVFSAYFDASGSSRSPVITVVGFVSRIEKWVRFEERWKALLPSTVSMFHMTDFASNKSGWEEWKGDGRRRATLVASLVSCIRSNTNQGFSATLQTKHYNEINRLYRFQEQFGSPYSFLSLSALGSLRKWSLNKRINCEKIVCVFEDGDEGQGDLINRARKDGFNAIPQSKADIRAFDACDLVAWKCRATVDAAFEKNAFRDDPASANKIMASISQIETVIRGKEFGSYSKRGLLALCDKFQVPKR